MRKIGSLVGVLLLLVVSVRGAMGGVVEDIVMGTTEPVINAISSGVSALWARNAERNRQEVESIKTRLEAAKWPNFDDISPQ